MTMFSKRDDGRSLGRTDARKSKRNRLFWTATSESRWLEPRTMLSLTVTTFPIPLVEIVQPQGIARGSDGNLWFTENASGQIGRMTPAGAVTQFALPAVPPPAGSPAGTASTTPNPTAITAGPDGALWFTGIPGEIGRITTAGVVTEFPVPAGTGSTPVTPTAIAAGPDGALWFTVPGEVGRISATGVVTEFPIPEIPPPAGSPPGTAGTQASLTAITAGPDGALWFTGVPGEVGRITTAGVVTEFAVPAIPPPAGSSPGTAGTPATLDDITEGPDGALWFTGVPGKLGRITTAGVVSEYATPNFSPPESPFVTMITTGPDGNLWITGNTGNGGNTAIGRITPTGTFTSFNVPGNFNTIGGLTSGPGGNVWFTEQEDGQTAGEEPAVGEITPAGVTKLYTLPQETTLNPNLGVPVDAGVITTGPDGALWFAENGAIGRITTAGAIQQFPLATPGATVDDITATRRGVVWFLQQDTDANDYNYTEFSIGRITTDGTITMYPVPANTSVTGITERRDGSVWFTENFSDPNTNAQTESIGRITRQGLIKTFPVHLRNAEPYDQQLGAITTGPDGNVWFTGGYSDKKNNPHTFIGRITARGQLSRFDLPSSLSAGSISSPPSGCLCGPTYTDSVISGPDGKLWFTAQYHDKSGIARISTRGALSPFIPAAIEGNLSSGPDGRVWFAGSEATRSGIVVTSDLPNAGNYSGMAVGASGSIWLTNGTTSIVRVSGLDGIAGGLDYRHRPKRAPDYEPTYAYNPGWTNVTTIARPTFAGIAKLGAEVTLWVQKQGDNQPVSIGRVKASCSDGSWTLTSRLKLSNGNYAVTATQTGDSGPPTVLYSLAPDPYSGDLSNALVIAANPKTNGTAVHTAETQAVPGGNAVRHSAASLPKRVLHS